jgi:hypothetical protein
MNHASMATNPVGEAMDDPREAARLCEVCDAAEPVGLPDWNRQEAIYESVLRLLAATHTIEEQRWVPRVQYVRPAWIYFKAARRSETRGDRRILVATTDISFEGIGVLSRQEIPVRHLLLQVSDVCFACDVRWSDPLGHQMYRYGLHAYDVVAVPRCE